MKKKAVKIISLLLIVVMLSACTGGESEKDASQAVLSTTVMDITIGRTGEISVLNYLGAVSWTSSDDNIATVSPTGVINALAIGSVAITAELENGDTMTCVVDVEPGESKVEEISVTSMYSDSSDITVDYNNGNTVTLKAECSPLDPEEDLAWSSSDEKLAQVDSTGLVTVYGNGTVEIKATALNGVEGKCLVRIKNVPATVQPREITDEPDVPVIEGDSSESKFTSPVPVTSPSAKSSVIISDKNVYLNVGESFQMTHAVGNISDTTVQWVSSDKAVALVKDGRIVAIGEGRATVSVVTADGAVASSVVAVGKEEINKLKKEVAESKAE